MKNNLLVGIFLFGILLIFGCESNTSKKTNEHDEVEQKVDTLLYRKQGEEITKATFKTLSTNLKVAIQKGGIDEAIRFCSVNAQPLTDSLNQYHNVEIKRTSHKIRNPLNSPTKKESEMLDKYLSGYKDPTIQVNQDGSVSFYSPIYTKDLCLTCHGKVENMTNYESILSKYPNDKAIGFSENELRGIWSLTFKQE